METILIAIIILSSSIIVGSIIKYVRRVRINMQGLVLSMRSQNVITSIPEQG